jgi:hypothetical protein
MTKKIYFSLGLMVIISLITSCNSVLTDSIPPGGINTLESGISAKTTAATFLDSSGNIDDLIALVNQYVDSGDIKGNAEKGLLAKLDSIKQKIINGQGNAATNELGAFINQVQAQQGKKISDKAAVALIALVQQTTAEILAGLSVTQATATASSAQPTKSTTQPTTSDTPGTVTTPTPLGDMVQHQAQWDSIASSVAGLVGFTNFTYDLFVLPANTAWQDTLAYYDAQAAAAGWGATHNQTGVIPNGYFSVWTTVNGGKTSYFVVVQVDNPEGSFTLNMFGE